MNGTDLHAMELEQGDYLEICFETVRGSLFLEIIAPDGTFVYRGNGRSISNFTVDIQQSGVYSILVEARHAQGKVYVEQRKSAELR